jgi:SAM-dependent methyltransferase
VSRGPGIGSPNEIPGPAPIRASPGLPASPAPLSSPATILAAYVAAQAFAGRSPLRLRLGVDGSARNGAADDLAEAAAWVTIDTGGDPDVRHDVTFGLPFGDGTVEAIEARHVLDPLGDMAIVLTREAARVLRPGGSLRVLTGDRAVALDHQRALRVQGVILVGLSAHLPSFTTESLVRLISGAGFRGAVGRPAGEGEIAVEATR